MSTPAFEERVEIMSKNNPDKIRSKWEKTGLLDKLSDEKAYQISQLCENQARHLLFSYTHLDKDTEEMLDYLKSICFPMIRRIFGGGEELAFTFETSVIPAFIYAREGESDEDGSAITISLRVFASYHASKKDLEEIDNGNHYYVLDKEVDKTILLSERFRNELNEKHAGKHLIFGYPFVIDRHDSGEFPPTLYYRCAVVDGGSRLVDGGYE